ncbi:hypothetical protein [Hasllibacter sp. MH4015]|uniref:hypothetical protein n=1 Tax=Hasllibacter sp. MH4015 TaxID=2854029 RepID=UPI001CD47842|nr:hypothetical protein [Hasllibacter sp. MH4015]
MRYLFALLIPTFLVHTGPNFADVPILRVGPTVPALADASRADPAAWQTAMPSIAVRAAFLARKEERGPNREHLQRPDNAYASGEEVFFYVSLANVARDPVGEDGARFAISLRAQVRSIEGAAMMDWMEVHTYTGTMTMRPDDPEYFQSWVTGGLAPILEPGMYQLALEFTDDLRMEDAARAPVEVVFDLLYPDQQP